MQLFYRSYGEGHPLIILHGLLGSSGNWHALAGKVFSREYRVLTIDQRNHGRSPHSEEFSYDVMVDDLIGLMDDLGLESAHLIGHSMGGKTAMHFALTHSERVDDLVVVDIAPVDYPDLHDETFEALFAVDPSEYSSRKEIENALAVYIKGSRVRQFLLKNVSHEDGRYVWKMNLEAIHRGYDTLREAVLGWQPFDGATLFIRGGKSDYVQDEHEISIRTLFPHAEMVTIDDVGHWIHAEAPDRFGEIVMAFLSKSDSVSG
ncbi:MAG: alpha/beta fold hydrolase [Bacteroidetes bacterium]|nr:alpha/beta fold hydrolase [Bacteroidota bacterium]